MLKIGLTGGIGSGKSTVAKVFEVLGTPVYYADVEAKKLMNKNEGLKQKIKELFGAAIYTDGALNRAALADIVFNDPQKLEQLNALVHPVTINDANQWLLQQKSPYAIKEAALIFESGISEFLDYVIGVYAPAPLRIQRVMQRDHTSKEAVMARLNNQMDEDEKMQLCNFVITNNEQQLLVPQVLALHEQLLNLANNPNNGKS